jgi:hypothetical protein
MIGKSIQQWIEIISENPKELKNAPLDIRNNKSVVKAALCQPFKEFVENNSHSEVASFDKSLSVFEFAGPNLRNDIEYIKELMPICSGYLFKYLDQDLRANSDLFLFALKYASKEYMIELAEKSVDESSVFNDFWEIIPRPQFEFDLEHKTILNNTDDSSSLEFLNDKRTILTAIDYQPIIYFRIGEELKQDYEIAFKAVSLYYGNFPLIPLNLKGDLEIVITYLVNEAKESVNYTRNFQPIFWDQIDQALKQCKDLYLRMIHEISFMNLNNLILDFAPFEIRKDSIIKEYLKINIS